MQIWPSKDSLDLGVSGSCWGGAVDVPATGDDALFGTSSPALGLRLPILLDLVGVRRILSKTSLGNNNTVSPCSTSSSSTSSSSTFSFNGPKDVN